MKHIKIAAGLAHVNYGNIAGAVKAAADAGADYIHSDAADMYDLKNMQLMGGHQIIEGIRPSRTSRSNVISIPENVIVCSSKRLPRQAAIC